MRNSLADVVVAALRVLDEQGLEGCSMRRVASALDVQPSALYHHVPNKQSLLALMADEIVRGVGGPSSADTAAPHGAKRGVRSVGEAAATCSVDEPRSLCIELREAMLAIRDGADVVATAAAFRLGSSEIEQRLAALVGADGARTLLLYTFGHAQSTQTHRQAAAFGALLDAAPGSISGATAAGAGEGSLANRTTAPAGTGSAGTAPAGTAPAGPAADHDPAADLDASFERGLDIILRGLAA